MTRKKASSRITRARRKAMLVLGMHRSGTSALTRVLSLLGADLPKNLMQGIPNNNETGFWESVDLMLVHDEMLASLGSTWDDIRPFPKDWFKSYAVQNYQNRIIDILEKDFSDSSLFLVKDPRICRFVPVWFSVLEKLRIEPLVVLPYRNPFEVAASLAKRDGFSTSKSLLLWLRHVVDAEITTRGFPRSVVSYDELLWDWEKTTTKISQDLRITWPTKGRLVEPAIEKFLDGRHRHTVFPRSSVLDDSDVMKWVRDVYAALLAIRAGTNASFERVVSRVAKELAIADQAFRPLLEENFAALRNESSKVVDAHNVLRQTQDAVADRDSKIATLSQEFSATRDQFTHVISQKDTDLAGIATQLAQRDEQVRSIEIEHQTLRDQLTQSQQVASGQDQRIKGLEDEISVAHAAVSQRETELTQARGEIEQRSIQIQQIETEMQSLREQVTQRQMEAAGRDERINGMEDELAQLHADVAQRTERVQALESIHQQMHDELTQAYLKISDRDQQIQERDQEMTVVRASVSQRETELTQARGEIEQRSIQIQQIETEMQSLREQVAQRQMEVAGRDELIKGMEDELAQLHADVAQGTERVQVLESVHQQMHEQLTQADVKLSDRDQQIQERDQEIIVVRAAVSQCEGELTQARGELEQRGMHLQQIEVLAQHLQVLVNERDHQNNALEQALAGAQGLITQRNTQLAALSEEIVQKDTELSSRATEAQNAYVLAATLEKKERDLREVDTRLSAALQQLSTIEVEMHERNVVIADLTKKINNRESRLHEIEAYFADAQAELTSLRTALRDRDFENSNSLTVMAERMGMLRTELESLAHVEQQRVLALIDSIKVFFLAEEIKGLFVDSTIRAMNENVEGGVARTAVSTQAAATYGNVVAIGSNVSLAAAVYGGGAGEINTLRRANNSVLHRYDSEATSLEFERAHVALSRIEMYHAKVNFIGEELQRCLVRKNSEIAKRDDVIAVIQKNIDVAEKRSCCLDAEVSELRSVLTKKQDVAKTLEQLLADRDRSVSQLQQLIDGHREEASQLATDISSLQLQITERESQMNEVKSMLEVRASQVEALKSSRSWRITAPFRWIRGFFI